MKERLGSVGKRATEERGIYLPSGVELSRLDCALASSQNSKHLNNETK